MVYYRINRAGTPTKNVIVNGSAVASVEIVKVLQQDSYSLVLRSIGSSGSWLIATRAKDKVNELLQMQDAIWKAMTTAGANYVWVDIAGDDIPDPPPP